MIYEVKFCNFDRCFSKVSLVFQKYIVTLWVKELFNVAQTIFIESTIQLDCYKLAIFALGSIIQKVEE